MKTSALFVINLLKALGAAAQGLIQFNTKAGTSSTMMPGRVWAPVYMPEAGNPFAVKVGNTPTGLAPGTQIYSGGFVIGPRYTAQLWAGPAGSTADQLVLVATTTFRTQTGTSVAGTVANIPPALSPSVPGVALGEFATFQLRAWDNRGGAVTSWTDVLSPQNDLVVIRGVSPVFTPPFALGDGSPAFPIPNLQGLQSFNLHLVPEPSALALALLGAGVFLLLRRRR